MQVATAPFTTCRWGTTSQSDYQRISNATWGSEPGALLRPEPSGKTTSTPTIREDKTYTIDRNLKEEKLTITRSPHSNASTETLRLIDSLRSSREVCPGRSIRLREHLASSRIIKLLLKHPLVSSEMHPIPKSDQERLPKDLSKLCLTMDLTSRKASPKIPKCRQC